MENYHCLKVDLTGVLLIGNIYNIFYKQNGAELCLEAPTSTEKDNLTSSKRAFLSYEQQLRTGL